MNPQLILFFLAILILITISSLSKSKHNQFYSDTFPLLPLGIFVWGDGLVLGPFWVVSGLMWLFLDLPLIWIWRYILIFWTTRSGYEVIYWLTHQASNADYTPPIGRHTKWLDRNQSRILYQVFHSSIVCLTIFLLLYSFFIPG